MFALAQQFRGVRPRGVIARGSTVRWPGATGSRPVYLLLALASLLIVALVPALGFAVAGRDFAVMVALLAGVVALAQAMRRVGLGRIADAQEGGAIILASGMATGCLSILLATLDLPLRDASLAAADAWLFPFLSWPGMAHALAAHPNLVEWMQAVYSTLLWQPFALVLLLAATGRSAVLWRFLHAWVLALVACLAIFAVAPAVTAQVHYGFPSGSIAGLTVNAGWRPAQIMLQVRSGTLHLLASGSMTGLIDFPSFHAMGAVLLGWGFWRAGPIGWPMVALDMAMIPTIPLIGSHYFVDVAAGMALAGVIVVATGRQDVR